MSNLRNRMNCFLGNNFFLKIQLHLFLVFLTVLHRLQQEVVPPIKIPSFPPLLFHLFSLLLSLSCVAPLPSFRPPTQPLQVFIHFFVATIWEASARCPPQVAQISFREFRFLLDRCYALLSQLLQDGLAQSAQMNKTVRQFRVKVLRHVTTRVRWREQRLTAEQGWFEGNR